MASNKRPHQEQPTPPVPTTGPTMAIPQGRKTKKPQKQVSKKSDPQSLVGMFDDASETYEKPISVRKVLKDNKINMSLLD